MSDKTVDCEKMNNFFGLVVGTDVPESETNGFVVYRDVVVNVNQRLMWTRNANVFRVKRTRIKAERLVNDLDCCGYSDWRLPTEEELLHHCSSRGISDQQKRPAILLNHIGFKDVLPSSYWTANGEIFVDLNYGSSGYGNEMNYIWPVRDGISKEEREQKQRDKIEAERLERQRQEEIRLEQMEAEKQQRLKLEKLQLERLTRKKELLQKLDYFRKSNYLDAGKFYLESCKDYISESEFKIANANFVKEWIAQHTLIEKSGKSPAPDDEQSSAIGEVWKNTQVIARAGSGKTTTLVNRAYFLQKHCGVAPSEMLLLAFNKKAADEMAERLDKKLNGNIPHTMTFHSLAYAIVHPEESILYDDPRGNQLSLSLAFQNIINDHLRKPEFEVLIREIMLAHFRGDWERIIQGGLNLSRDEMLHLRRSLPRESLGGDAVKSYGEKVIADFLFEHDLKYRYERNYIWGNFNYRPDFTVFCSDQSGVIIEYFGLSGDPDYDEMSEKKREYWSKQGNWQLLEYTPTDIVSDGAIQFRHRLKEELATCGIICKKLSEDEIWERLKKRSIDRYTAAIKSFILKCRKYWLEPENLAETIKDYTPLTEPERMFNSLALHFYRCYLERIEATGEDDFDGLMQKATLAIESGNTRFDKKTGSGDLQELRYIFIDEFQDFSEHFWRLTDAIRKQNPAVKFFCVGDDWQAINGFAGSDLKFFSNFTNHFDNPSQKHIATNYRSAQKIVNIGNALMDGLGKPARSNKEVLGEVVIADLSTFIDTTLQERQRHNTDKITPAVTRLVANALNLGSPVVLLSRTNRLPYYLSDVNQEKTTENQHEDFLLSVRSYFPEALRKRITISTAHKYKGLEKHTVIILDAVMRSYPLIHPDWVFSRILGDDPQKILEEERRLFYVALTRAVEKLIIITEGEKVSPFLEGLRQKIQLQNITWDKYPPPPALGEMGVVVVKITSQPSRGSNPSYSIKDLLKASGYAWESTGRKPWVKGFPSISFDIENVKHELWATNADGIEVGIFDEQQIELKRYYVDSGEWREMRVPN